MSFSLCEVILHVEERINVGQVWRSLRNTLKPKQKTIPDWRYKEPVGRGVYVVSGECVGILLKSWMFCVPYQSSCIEIKPDIFLNSTGAWRFNGSESLFPNVKVVKLFHLHSYSLNVWWLLDLHYLRWPPYTRGVSLSDRLLQLLNYSFMLFARLAVRDWKLDKDSMIED